MSGKTNNNPIFLVCGASGKQGSSVIKALLKSGKWRIRGIARDTECEKVKWLKDSNVELIKCDLNSTEEVRRAMNGVHTVFGMTDYWDPSQRGKEVEIGKRLVDCAKESGVKHFIFSGLPNVETITGGKCDCPHFSDKAKASEYAFKNVPTTIVMLGHYYQNFGTLLKGERQNDGTLLYRVPKVNNLSGVDVCDLGEAICNIAANRDNWIGRSVPLCGDNLALDEYLKTMKDITGQKMDIKVVPFEEFEKIGGKELAHMYRYVNEFGFFGPNADFNLGKKANPNMKTFRQFLESTNPK